MIIGVFFLLLSLNFELDRTKSFHIPVFTGDLNIISLMRVVPDRDQILKEINNDYDDGGEAVSVVSLFFIYIVVFCRIGSFSSFFSMFLFRHVFSIFLVQTAAENANRRSTLGFDRFKFPLEETSPHVPVMLGEVLQVFQSVHLRSFVDCTLGAAGHSLPIIGSHPEMHFYFGLDVDPVAFELGRSRIHSVLHTPNSGTNIIDRSQLLKVYTHLRNFKHIKSVISTAALEDDGFLLLHKGINGVLMDLGMSSMQVNDSNRGFSILGDGPLDMRMDPQASLKAEEILNLWPETEVGRIIRDYGEESNWRLLQKKIVNARSFGGLHSTNDLVQLIQKLSFNGSGGRQGWIKTATRVFQALRIAVNDELKTLEDSLYACFDSLSPGGRLAVISFHSLEDRIVKQTFLDIISKKHNNSGITDDSSALPLYLPQEEETWCKGRISGTNGIILNKRPITPCEEEEKLNKRSRSAKLRVIQKI